MSLDDVENDKDSIYISSDESSSDEDENDLYECSSASTPGHENWTFQSYSTEGAKYHSNLSGSQLGMNAVQLKYNCSSELMLPKVQQESSEITKRIRKVLRVDNNYKFTRLDSFKICLPPGWVIAVKEWLNSLSSNASPPFSITDQDFRAYLLVEISLRVAGKSFSECLEDPPGHWNLAHTVSYSKVRKAMSLDKSNRATKGSREARVCSSSPIIHEMGGAAQRHWVKMFFVPKTTWIDLDDDKLPYGSPQWENFGIRTIPTKTKKQKPVIHLVCSVGTGLLLVPRLETSHSPVHKIVSKAIDFLNERESGESPDASVSSELRVFIDRGYLALSKPQDMDRATNITQILQSKGVKFLGTCRKTSSFPFIDVEGPVPATPVRGSQTIINRNGRRSTYTAQRYQNGDFVAAMMMRHGAGKHRVAQLITNDRCLADQVWSYEVLPAGVDWNSPGGVKRVPHAEIEIEPCDMSTYKMKAQANHKINLVNANIFSMTISQRTPDWFMARQFRITSTGAFTCINFKNAPFVHSDELMALHHDVKSFACLDPQRIISLFPRPNKRSSYSSEGAQKQYKRKRQGEGLILEYTYWMQRMNKNELIQKLLSLDVGAKTDGKKIELAKRIVDILSRTIDHETVSNGELSSLQEDIHPQHASQESTTQDLLEMSDSSDIGDSFPLHNSETIDDNHTCTFEERQKSFLRTITPSWFMKPTQNGFSNHKNPLALGIENEADVAKDLSRWVKKASSNKFCILQLRKYGLIINREVQFVADSPDGAAVLLRNTELEGNNFVIDDVFALEIKTSTNAKTIDELKSRVAGQSAWHECKCGTSEFESLVPNPSFRTQCIHHAATLDVPYTLLIYATTEEIMQGVLIKVSCAQRQSWREYFKALSDEYMGFAYGNQLGRFPRFAPDQSPDWGYAVDLHSAELALQLWRRHSDDVLVNGTPPPCKRLLPLTVSVWNKMMGGVDITRKTINGASIRTSKLTPNALVCLTFIDYILYNSFRAYQLLSMEHRNLTSKCKTITEWSMLRKNLCCYRGYLSSLAEEIRVVSMESLYPFDNTCSMSDIEFCWRATDNTISPTSTASLESPQQYQYSKSRLPELLQTRLVGQHECVGKFKKRGACIMCCVDCERGSAPDHPYRNPRKTTRWCQTCNAYICKHCNIKFHSEEQITIPHFHT